MRVAFGLIGGAGWTGGVNYLENLLSALAVHPGCQIEAVLFAGTDADPVVLNRLKPYLAEPPILHPVWNNARPMRLARLACGMLLQRDYLAERIFRQARIDLVFQHGAWYGKRFGIPTLAWIADFQHRRLPAMFSKANYYWRDIGYWALSHCATRLMVSSEDAKRDCEQFYPASRGRVDAVPFSVRMQGGVSVDQLEAIRATYALPEKFFFMPNQFWKHKNHLNVVEALHRNRSRGGKVVIVASGNAADARHPKYPQAVLDLIAHYKLNDVCMVLGLIPFAHILPLMRLSAGVLNPSFFEGWSTSVEEAKAVGAPLLLSDLPIHREQTEGKALYFDAHDPASIDAALEAGWATLGAGPRLHAEQTAAGANEEQRARFAASFADLATQTIRIGNARS